MSKQKRTSKNEIIPLENVKDNDIVVNFGQKELAGNSRPWKAMMNNNQENYDIIQGKSDEAKNKRMNIIKVGKIELIIANNFIFIFTQIEYFRSRLFQG